MRTGTRLIWAGFTGCNYLTIPAGTSHSETPISIGRDHLKLYKETAAVVTFTYDHATPFTVFMDRTNWRSYMNKKQITTSKSKTISWASQTETGFWNKKFRHSLNVYRVLFLLCLERSCVQFVQSLTLDYTVGSRLLTEGAFWLVKYENWKWCKILSYLKS